MGRHAHFIIPAKEKQRPRVLRLLGQSDYLCQIRDSYDKKTIDVRVVFVHRNGFRRRRLVTSLLDPVQFSASELAALYHMRWDIDIDLLSRFQVQPWCNLLALSNAKLLSPGTSRAHDRLLSDTHSHAGSQTTGESASRSDQFQACAHGDTFIFKTLVGRYGCTTMGLYLDRTRTLLRTIPRSI